MKLFATATHTTAVFGHIEALHFALISNCGGSKPCKYCSCPNRSDDVDQ